MWSTSLLKYAIAVKHVNQLKVQYTIFEYITNKIIVNILLLLASIAWTNFSSTSWKDNMCEAAVELYKATKDQQYLNDAKGWFNSGTAWGYSWDDQNAGCQVHIYFNI